MHSLLIEAKGLEKTYKVRKGFFSGRSYKVNAVRGVSLGIMEGEILGLVGESGSGKSTLARILLGLERPTKGKVMFRGRSLWEDGKRVPREFRRICQMIFQDPVSSLNPKKTVFDTLKEPLLIHGLLKRKGLREGVGAILKEVGLSPSSMDRYPHELSGGQKQRVGIARALSTRPAFIVADEPTSALDVSIQAQIINLVLDLHERYRLTILFISHAIPLVQFVSHRIAVMYGGSIVEIYPRKETPVHPYTLLLLKAVPLPGKKGPFSWEEIRGKVFDGGMAEERNARGCPFYQRCGFASYHCRETMPDLRELDKGHVVACLRFQ